VTVERTKAGWMSTIHKGIDTSIELRCIELEILMTRLYA